MKQAPATLTLGQCHRAQALLPHHGLTYTALRTIKPLSEVRKWCLHTSMYEAILLKQYMNSRRTILLSSCFIFTARLWVVDLYSRGAYICFVHTLVGFSFTYVLAEFDEFTTSWTVNYTHTL